VQQHDTMMLV